MKTVKPLLAKQIREHRKEIEEWNERQRSLAPPPFYCSVDLRDSGYKIVPVDCNIYPAGFNNICPDDLRTASPLFREHVTKLLSERNLPTPTRILILPESHTKNAHYIENLYYLTQIISEAGYEVRLGWYAELPEGSIDLRSQTGKELRAYSIQISGGLLSAGGFIPDLILLNNDFSAGYPKLLDQVCQPIVPSHVLGWHSRTKGEHFRHYNDLAEEFAQLIGIDPWLIQVATDEISHVDFSTDEGIADVEASTRRILGQMESAFTAHGVSRKPFVFIKNSSGTYGMGIMVVHSLNELENMNRRTRNKMSTGKDKHPIHSVIVQEGVPTATLVDRLPAEPVVYLFGDELVGGFLRTHTERGAEENLNSPGMVFRKLCMSDLRHPQGIDASFSEEENPEDPVLELVYGTIGRISVFAAGRELARLRALQQESFTPPKPETML